MAKYLSGRAKRDPQSALSADRYKYLDLKEAEPNLGDPSVIPQTLPVGQQYQVISVLGSPGNRFWIPVGGGLIPGAITVFDEGVIVPTNAGVSSITQVNFVGAAISAKGYVYADGSPGIGVTITVFAPGNNQQLLFNNNNEFGTSSLLTFDNVTGILTAGKALNVGIGGTVITATSLGLVGIGTTNPTQELDVNGDIRIRGTIYDYNNQPGVNQQVLIKNNFGGLEWNNQSSIRAGAGGTYTQVQYHNASGLVDGATGFVYDPNTNKVGIGSTSPRYILDVIGTVNISGLATITNLYVSGIGTFNDIVYVISTEQSTSTSTGALVVSGGVGIAKNLNVGGVAGISSLNVTNHTTSGSLYVSGISTLGVTTATNLTAQTLRVSGISTLGVTTATDLTAQSLVVSGVSTLGVTSTTNLTSQTLNVSGISTLGVTTATNLTAQTLRVSGISTLGVTTATDLTAQTLNIFGTSTFYGNILPGSNGFYDIGNVLYKFNEVYADTFIGQFIGNADTATTATNVNGGTGNLTALNVSGISTLGVTTTTDLTAQSLVVSGTGTITNLTGTNLNITGISTFQGNVTLGDANTDKVSFGATVDSNIIPSGSRNLGSVANPWSNVYATTITGTIAGNADTATKLLNARTIAITGDLAYTSPAFDGTGNVTATGTLAATTVVAGSYGSGSQVATFTVDAKGRLTAASNTSITGINASSVAAAGADTQIQFNDGGAFAGDADFTFAKTTNTVTTRFLALNGNGSTTSAQLAFNGGTNNWITFGTTGVAAPAFTTRSVGTKIVLYDGIGSSSADYGFGIESSTLWSSVPTTSNQFKWYGGTTLAATLSGAGAFTAVGAISGTQLNGTLQYALTLNTSGTGLSGSTTYNNSGAATFTVTSNATSANTASTIVARDGNGDFSARYINSSYFNSTDDISTGTLTHLMGKFGDNYHRSATAAKVATFISGQTMNINGSSTSCSGNAATATNVAYSGLTGTVPTWNQNTTGNAATATTATTATYLNTANSSSISDNITNRINSGFWETSTATTGEGWPTTTNNWYHLISSTHSNTTNHYALQLAAPFFTQNLYYRSTGGIGSTAWKQVDAFASGTTIVFYQAAAPTGWTKSTSHDNIALRVVNGTGGGSGGTTAFTTVFASRTPTGSASAHTLTVAEMPGHVHSPVNGQNYSFGISTGAPTGLILLESDGGGQGTNVSTTASTGGGEGHSHGFVGNAMDFAVQYIDVIICSKD